MTMLDVERLLRDPTARPELARYAIRANRPDLLTEDELRAHAWRLIEAGAEVEVEVGGRAVPLRHRTQLDALVALLDVPRTLVAPIAVPMLWDETRARLYAVDCAERVLPTYEQEHPGDGRPRRAVEVVRRYARGEETKAAYATWVAAATATVACAVVAHGATLTTDAYAADTETAWQTRRLLAYLLDRIDLNTGEMKP